MGFGVTYGHENIPAHSTGGGENEELRCLVSIGDSVRRSVETPDPADNTDLQINPAIDSYLNRSGYNIAVDGNSSNDCTLLHGVSTTPFDSAEVRPCTRQRAQKLSVFLCGIHFTRHLNSFCYSTHREDCDSTDEWTAVYGVLTVHSERY